MSNLLIRPLSAEDRDWVFQFVVSHWDSDRIVLYRGKSSATIHYPQALPGFAAFQEEKVVGLVTFHIEGDDCEIVTLDSLNPGIGIGTALLDAVKDRACQAHCTRLSITTTNDNLNALRFYQKRGFLLVAVYRNAVDMARKLKPQILLIGRDGIPVHDEIELQMNLETWAGWNTRSHALGFRKEEHMFMLSRSAGNRLHTN
jgi:ribosomal protein S18 acetylase RimI-like enzyme